MFDVSSPYRQDIFFSVFWVSFDVRNLPKTNFKRRFKGHQHTSNIDTLQNELQGYQTSIQPMLYYSELILALFFLLMLGPDLVAMLGLCRTYIWQLGQFHELHEKSKFTTDPRAKLGPPTS